MANQLNYIKWGFKSRLKPDICVECSRWYYIKWGFKSRLKPYEALVEQIEPFVKTPTKKIKRFLYVD